MVSDEKSRKSEQTFTLPTPDDGTEEIASGGFFSSVLDTDGKSKTETDLIKKYRNISQQPECDAAIEDIVNEGIVANELDRPVEIVLDRLPYPETIKRKIRKEFHEILTLLDFNIKGHDILRRWYVDGRIFYHKVIDSKNPKKGVTELRWIDALKIKKVRQVKDNSSNNTHPVSNSRINIEFDEFFVYNENGINSGTSGLTIAKDAITYVPSGIIDGNSGRVISYLHKAIKPVNQLRMIEDALVIYRISRAPERRIFYIDVGNLPKVKEEQYLKDVMNRYRNKFVYDASTGEIRDDRNHMSMLEDFWLPRREGGRGTEISTLPGGQNLGEIDDILYFQKKLYRSLNVPISRLEAEQNFSLGRSTEITRDELKFTKFVQRIRKKFTPLFTDLLKTQLLLKGIITSEDWDNMQEHIQYDFLQDGHFTELKEAELLRERVEMLDTMQSYMGTFFSKEYVWKKVLRFNDGEVEDMLQQMKKEQDMDTDEGGQDMDDYNDGITRMPVDSQGNEQPPPEEPEEPPEPEEPEPDDIESDKSFFVKNGLKRKKK